MFLELLEVDKNNQFIMFTLSYSRLRRHCPIYKGRKALCYYLYPCGRNDFAEQHVHDQYDPPGASKTSNRKGCADAGRCSVTSFGGGCPSHEVDAHEIAFSLDYIVWGST
jgi:hypothetical protein